MSILIQLQDIHKAYGTHTIFDDASVSFAKSDKIGGIGRNGAGKTTLCKLITGEEDPEAGTISKSPRLRLSYLEQGTPFAPEEEVLAFLMRYTQKTDWQCGKVAGRFQLKGDVLQTKISDLPGGYQTRVKLTAMLLSEPNFLILDEPTNYLDLRTLILLERFLKDFPGGYLIISHDREFLKRTCRQSLEIERGALTLFPGNIEAYLEYKVDRVEEELRYNKNLDAKRRHLQDFVARYRVRKATASRAQSRLKQLSRLETINIESPLQTVRIRLPKVEPKKGVALTCTDLSVGYPDHTVANHLRFEIERGEHVAILGDNGEGKTTFLKTIAGQLAPCGGEYKWGHEIRHAFYAQHVYSKLNPKDDVLTTLKREAASDVLPQEILDLAGSFLFQGDDVYKPISVLSGGERARVCLASLLLSRRPVLLLDEPTNHLDFETVEALGRALNDYAGTVFFVSHDRTFVQLVATNILEVKDGTVKLYPDNYESYVYQAEREITDAESLATNAKTERKAAPTNDYELRKERRSRINKLRRRAEQLEKRLAEYEKERDEIHQHFLDKPLEYSKERRQRHDELAQLVTAAESEWVEVNEELESLEKMED